jgi:ketosteroid isomerase-like protein
MTMGEARDVAERFYERFGGDDLAGVTALFADGCSTVTPAGTFDKVEHEAFGRAFRDAFPDARMVVVRAVEAGDEVYVTGRFEGTHEGDLVAPQGTIPASGRSLAMPFADYFRVRAGKIVEHEVIWDQMGMLAQLGALPAG